MGGRGFKCINTFQFLLFAILNHILTIKCKIDFCFSQPLSLNSFHNDFFLLLFLFFWVFFFFWLDHFFVIHVSNFSLSLSFSHLFVWSTTNYTFCCLLKYYASWNSRAMVSCSPLHSPPFYCNFHSFSQCF